MAKNSRRNRNRKDREQSQILGLYLDRIGQPRPEKRSGFSISPNRDNQENSEECDAEGRLLVHVESDLAVFDVPTSQLPQPPPGKPRTKTIDVERYHQ